MTFNEMIRKKVFRKLVFVINTCCPIMAETAEIRWENTYWNFIEYVIEHDSFDFPDADNIWNLYHDDIPNKGSVRNCIFKKMPAGFVQKTIERNFYRSSIRC